MAAVARCQSRYRLHRRFDMFGLIRRAWRSVTLTDETDAPCDCESCTFAREVDSLTAGHIAAAILASPDLPSALLRAAAINDAVTFAVDTANHEWRLTDPAVAAEVQYLDDLYGAPAYGQESWGPFPATRAADALDEIDRAIDAHWSAIEDAMERDESTRDNPQDW